MTSNPTPKQAALGTLEQVAGKRVLRFERRLDHPVERVWAALTEPEQLAGWLAAADELELAEGDIAWVRWAPASLADEPQADAEASSRSSFSGVSSAASAE